MKKHDNSKPFPIRLGDELKPFLQQEASMEDRSLHYLCKKILLDFKKKERDEYNRLHNIIVQEPKLKGL